MNKENLGELLIRVYGDNAKKEFEEEFEDVMRNSNCREDFKKRLVKDTAADIMYDNLESIITGLKDKVSIRAIICRSYDVRRPY